MPGRTRHAPPSVAEVIQKEDPKYIPGLAFNEPLTWRAGKAIPVADLLLRLQALAKELRKLDQDQLARTAFTRVAQDLVNPNLLGHKDKGVRAYVSCCVVDILRLCAPDAPFTNTQLRVCGNIYQDGDDLMLTDSRTYLPLSSRQSCHALRSPRTPIMYSTAMSSNRSQTRRASH